MNDQLLGGSRTGSRGIAAAVGGVPWLATATLAAAVPFLTVGALLALGGIHARPDGAAGSTR